MPLTDSHSCPGPKYHWGNRSKQGVPTCTTSYLRHLPPSLTALLRWFNPFRVIFGLCRGRPKRRERGHPNVSESPALPQPVPPSAAFSFLTVSSVFCLPGTMTVGNMERAELFDAGSKGRGLRAAKELNTGEVIFSEPSFAAVVFDRYGSPGRSGFCMNMSQVYSDCGRWSPSQGRDLPSRPLNSMTSATRRPSRCHVNLSVTFWIQCEEAPAERIMAPLQGLTFRLY